ncbi:MAG: beta-glucosidase family protein [Acidimicrobiales bacterium]
MEAIAGGVAGGLSFDEKAALTGGADLWHTVPVERLGVPALRLSDGPSGVRGPRFTGDTSVCVPCSTALAATWDRALVERVGGLLGDQARAKDVHVLLAPTINLHRHPLGGRHFESFSEDPYLTAQVAVAYIRGVQSRRVACTAKHFVANDQEHERMEVSIEVDERTLHEMYLPPFEAAVRDAGVWAVMAAYNRLHGVHCSEHAGLLDVILRQDWGFDGLVMSDWYGTHSTAAVGAGLDLEMPGPPRYLGHYLAAAVHQGDLPEAALDRAVSRLFGLLERVTGAPDEPQPPQLVEDPAELGRIAARDAIVLLCNDDVLPLDPARHRTLAVLGPKADRPDIQGGGSAHVHPLYEVTPLDAIVERAGDTATVRHEAGVAQRPAVPLGRRELRVPGSDEPGLRIEYFEGAGFEGEPLRTGVVADSELFWLGPPLPGMVLDEISIRAMADFTPDRTGAWRLHVTNAGAALVRVDGAVVLDNLGPQRGSSFFGRGSTPVEGEVVLEAGTTYPLAIELHIRRPPGVDTRWISGVHLHAQPPEDADAVARAVAAAADADVAVVVVGADKPDTEGADREGIDLPAAQTELIRAVAAANPATVVVLNTGSPVTMDWVDEVGAVAQLWYPGQEAGAALADVLFGDTDAAGRLPTSFPRRIEDTPAHPHYPGEHGRAPYGEGLFVGYRHYDAHQVEPLFCFGHGLSYTRFDYGELAVEVDEQQRSAVVTLEIANVGDRQGREVVQLYVHDVAASVARPERELKQFAKVDLAPGETQAVRLELPAKAFAFWDVHHHDWMVEPGEFEIAVGASSRDIRRTIRITL